MADKNKVELFTDSERAGFCDFPIKADADAVYRGLVDEYKNLACIVGVILSRHGLLQAVEECKPLAWALYQDAEARARAALERADEAYPEQGALFVNSARSRFRYTLLEKMFSSALLDEGGEVARLLSERFTKPKTYSKVDYFLYLNRLPAVCDKASAIGLAIIWIKYKTLIDADALDSVVILLQFIHALTNHFHDLSESNARGRDSLLNDPRKAICCSQAIEALLDRNGGELPTRRGWRSDLYTDIAHRWNTFYKTEEEAEVRQDAARKWLEVFYPDMFSD